MIDLELKTAYDRFRSQGASYLADVQEYKAAIERTQAADLGTWNSVDFQTWLWNDESGVKVGIGPKTSMEVTRDLDLSRTLWELRRTELPADLVERARFLDERFEGINGQIHQRHIVHPPQARLIRVFALLLPAEVVGLVWDYRVFQLRRRLDLRTYGRAVIGQSVLIQATLRRVLGAADNLDEVVWRNLFARWLALGRGEGGGDSDDDASPDEDKLRLKPVAAQVRGVTGISGTVDTLLSIVRHTESGVTLSELLDAVRRERPKWTVDTIRSRIAGAKNLRLISYGDGEYKTTALGLDLLEGAPPSDVLAPVLLANNVGVAPLLNLLKESHQLSQQEATSRLQSLDPEWRTNTAPQRLISWTRAVGLIERDPTGALRLTEAGRSWADRLPERLPPLTSAVDEDEDDRESRGANDASSDARPAANTHAYRFKPVPLTLFQAEVELDLVLEDGFVQSLHASLHSTPHKRFVLLSGLSGTGKSSVARAYADAYCRMAGCKEPKSHQAIVPVRPDWTDPSGLLGYVNALTSPPTWRRTGALELLLRANRRPQLPFFLILEEMNLARVEHYFAPLLSAMEHPDGELCIHAETTEVDVVPPVIPWPHNLFILGTVNMDETTFPFSDKVIDRAFVFEFWEVDLERWRKVAERRGPKKHVTAVFTILKALHDVLKPARRHFGYRTCDEVLGFCVAANDSSSQAIDVALLAKIVPRLRGYDSQGFSDVLREAKAVCERADLRRSTVRIQEMINALSSTGISYI